MATRGLGHTLPAVGLGVQTRPQREKPWAHPQGQHGATWRCRPSLLHPAHTRLIRQRTQPSGDKGQAAPSRLHLPLQPASRQPNPTSLISWGESGLRCGALQLNEYLCPPQPRACPASARPPSNQKPMASQDGPCCSQTNPILKPDQPDGGFCPHATRNSLILSLTWSLPWQGSKKMTYATTLTLV